MHDKRNVMNGSYQYFFIVQAASNWTIYLNLQLSAWDKLQQEKFLGGRGLYCWLINDNYHTTLFNWIQQAITINIQYKVTLYGRNIMAAYDVYNDTFKIFWLKKPQVR